MSLSNVTRLIPNRQMPVYNMTQHVNASRCRPNWIPRRSIEREFYQSSAPPKCDSESARICVINPSFFGLRVYIGHAARHPHSAGAMTLAVAVLPKRRAASAFEEVVVVS